MPQREFKTVETAAGAFIEEGFRCSPGCEAGHVMRFGYESPMAEFLYGSPNRTVNEIALKWAIEAKPLFDALARSGYLELRAERIRKMADEIYDSERVRHLRDVHIANRWRQGQEVNEETLRQLARGFETPRYDVTGKRAGTRPLTPLERKRLIDGWAVTNEEISIALGMPSKITIAVKSEGERPKQLEISGFRSAPVPSARLGPGSDNGRIIDAEPNGAGAEPEGGGA